MGQHRPPHRSTRGRRAVGGVRRRVAATAGALALAAGLVAAGPQASATDLVAAGPQASAAGLTQVTGFGTNPGNLSMYAYAPDALPSGAPLVVALHGCTQSAGDYHAHSGWSKYADLYGFALVFPQTSSANNGNSCFNWFEPGDSARDRGEALSIRQMVDKAVSRYGSDTRRVYVTGLSAGGAMTANLLAAYPDVFAGGAVASGLPAYCAGSVTAAYSCMYAPQDRTPAQWGALVRAAAPAGTTSWPRVAIWQGTADTTVRPANATELRDQWTDVWGVGQTPSRTRSLAGGTTLSIHDDASGRPAVEVYSVPGMGHGLAVDPGGGTGQCGTAGAYYLDAICSSYHTALFWGLDGGDGDPGTGALPAPTGLTVTGTTDTTAALRWNAVAEATSYAVFRGGTKVGGTTSTAYTDIGLATGTTYGYAVAAVDSAGAAGALSPVVTATTTGFTPTCHTASNYDHTVAGRARESGGHTYAKGSDQPMGLWNTFITHTLRQTSPGHYVIADSGCAVRAETTGEGPDGTVAHRRASGPGR
ncbi:extracellular catalytic domain type 1 short-chain-length polyhydroxyalkanoate depolymerase [Streptomyces roseolilacinus]|uniref:extracellular catalytic domain type 1 short-chain-length polyhydroxyalkanoate depolymerase n=1 Tax=Streptomyces roseolilacinus TaxID=66904 RepID=UPI0038142146